MGYPLPCAPGMLTRCFPGSWLGLSHLGLALPGMLRASLSFALHSWDASAKAVPAAMAATGTVLSLRPDPCPSPQRTSAASSSLSLAGAASQFRSLSTQKGQSESFLPVLGSLHRAVVPAPCRGPCTVLVSDSLSFLPSLNALDLMPQASTCSCSFFLPNYSS